TFWSATCLFCCKFSSRTDCQFSALGKSKAQCTPVPLPALGTQKIIQGNGTNVGTVISLQCPAKHRLVGSEMKCVMGANSTYWAGETYCKPLSSFEDFGFRVAVLASIVSSGIIIFMSVAFITCCLLDCIKEEERKKEEKSRCTFRTPGLTRVTRPVLGRSRDLCLKGSSAA
uniref:Sushi domain containing 3 n=1 Tax=Amphilophus citrinellus TaxID=61819 RepID=A0A3Q0QZZ5_AMPCI